MNTYPQELVTPPLALVALLGCPNLHSSIGEYLRSQHRPPINSLGLPDPWAAGRLFGERKGMLTAPTERAGILKVDWFSKHRKRRPAVAVIFLQRNAVTGDASTWAKSCSALEAVKSAAKARSAKVVVVVVGPSAELPEERSGAISRIAAVEKKYIVLFNPEEEAASLKALGKLVYESAGQFYLDSARRQLSMLVERRGITAERSARTYFKAAALAEFRADWATAVKTYQTAYAEISRIGLGTEHPLQKAHEVAAVAEQIHIKVVTLLLHQLRLPEALAQFKAHMGLFQQLPLPAPPVFAAAHWGWLARQYTAMGELMASRTDSSSLQGDASPVHLFLWAAKATVERRKSAEAAAAERNEQGPRSPKLASAITLGDYLGQYVAKEPTRHLSDAEFLQFLEAKEASIKHGNLAVEALDLAQEVCARMGGRASRLAYYIGQLLATEHMGLGDYETAYRLLLPIAGIYRREGWSLPLIGAVRDLRECAQKLKYTEEDLIYTLELAALTAGNESGRPGSDSDTSGPESFVRKAESAINAFTAENSTGAMETGGVPMRLQVVKLNHPLHSCFSINAGFLDIGETETLPKHISLGVHILNCLPFAVPIQGLEAIVKISQGANSESLHLKLAAESAVSQLPCGKPVVETAQIPVKPGDVCSITEIVLHISEAASISWTLDGLPGPDSGRTPNSVTGLVRSQQLFTPGLYEVTVPVSVEPPRVEISRDPFALLGERALVQLEVLAPTVLEKPCLRVYGGFMEATDRLSIDMTPTEGAEWTAANEEDEQEDGSPRETFLGTVTLDSIAKNSVKVVEMDVFPSQAGQLKISAQLEYEGQDLEQTEGLVASTELQILAPFELSTHCYTSPDTFSMIPAEADEVAEGDGTVLPAASPCYLATHIRNLAPTQVIIREVSVFPAEGLDVRIQGKQFTVPHSNIQLTKGDSMTSIFSLQAAARGSINSAGMLSVKWLRTRAQGDDAPLVETQIALPPLRFVEAELELRVDTPGEAIQGEPIPVRIQISNKTAALQEVKLNAQPGSGFVMAGMRHEMLALRPEETRVISLSLVACQSGLLTLPAYKILSLRHNAMLEVLSDRQILVTPTYLSKSAETSRVTSQVETLSIH